MRRTTAAEDVSGCFANAGSYSPSRAGSPRSQHWLVASLFLIAGSLSGQVYPPGQYPPGQQPGQYPPGSGAGIPNPFPHKKKKTDDAEKPTVNSGLFFDVEENGFALQLKDKRVLIFQVQKDTKFTNNGKDIALSDLAPGDELEVQSKSDPNNNLFAVAVKLIRKAPHSSGTPAGESQPIAAGAASASNTAPPEPPPTILQREDSGADESQPRLKRGKPKKSAHDDDLEKEVARDATAAPQKPVAEAAASPSPASSDEAEAPPNAPAPNAAAEPSTTPVPGFRDADPFIAKAREANGEALEKLPNFVCEQYTTRYASDRRPAEWMPQDVLSAKVIYEDGKETYQDIKLNNRSVKDPAKTHDGAWSTGEFGSILADLMSPATAANFHGGTNTTLNGRDSRVYDFEVQQEHSHWKVVPTSQYYYPAFNGSIWFDRTTARALRIESGAIDMPKEFPFDTVESAVDYDYVSIGARKALLPVKAEVLACERNTANCSRNVIEFRNYHQFGSETEIKIGP